MSEYEWLQTEHSICEKRKILSEYVSNVAKSNECSSGFPRKLYLFPTRRCNLNCKHCYVNRENANSDRELDLNTIIKLVKQLRCSGLETVKISGGEPLLRSDISELVHSLLNMGLSVSVETKWYASNRENRQEYI